MDAYDFDALLSFLRDHLNRYLSELNVGEIRALGRLVLSAGRGQ